MARSQVRQAQRPPIDAWGGAGRLGLIFSLLYRFGPPRWSQYVRKNWAGQRLVIALPYVWLFLFFAVPFLIVLRISFSEEALARPPYTALIAKVGEAAYSITINLANYSNLVSESLFFSSYVFSVKLAAISTLLCLLVGYPMAYAIARASSTMRVVWLMLIILPFWTSFLLRVYAWVGLLKTDGLINQILGIFGLGPFSMMYTTFAVYVGIVYSYLPFMILPLYANLEKHDLTLLEAAADLGAGPIKSFFRVTLPLSASGIVAGSLLVFIPAVGEYVIPTLLGPSDQLMIGSVLQTEFFSVRNWPSASAAAIAMLLLLVLPILVFQRFQDREFARAKK